MECALGEQAVFIGTKGRLTLEPAHAPTQLTIWINNRPDSYPGAYHGLYVPEDATVVKYSLLDPVTRGVGQPAGYNFPNSSGFTFQVGHRRLAPAPPPHSVPRELADPSFSCLHFQAEAVHRCLAIGMLSCPQYTKEESLTVSRILDGIQANLEAQPAPIQAPTPGATHHVLFVPSPLWKVVGGQIVRRGG